MKRIVEIHEPPTTIVLPVHERLARRQRSAALRPSVAGPRTYSAPLSPAPLGRKPAVLRIIKTPMI